GPPGREGTLDLEPTRNLSDLRFRQPASGFAGGHGLGSRSHDREPAQPGRQSVGGRPSPRARGGRSGPGPARFAGPGERGRASMEPEMGEDLDRSFAASD